LISNHGYAKAYRGIPLPPPMLKESLELQVSYAMGYYSSAPSSTLNLSATNVDVYSDDAQLSDHPGKKALPELQQVGIASATHIGPAQR